MKITAEINSKGKLTGRFQRGDWSKHSKFDNKKAKVFETEKDFDEAIEKHNKSVHEQFYDDVAKAKGFKNSKEMSDCYENYGTEDDLY